MKFDCQQHIAGAFLSQVRDKHAPGHGPFLDFDAVHEPAITQAGACQSHPEHRTLLRYGAAPPMN